MEFRVLGPLEVGDGDRTIALGGFRQRLVLGALLLRRNRVATTDWLIDAVWGEDSPRTARKTLQVYIARLRNVLGASRIAADETGYVLHVEDAEYDASRFEHSADEGHRLLAPDPSAAARVLRRALSEWRGLPWGDLGDEPAMRPEAQRLRELRLDVVQDRIAADLEIGRVAPVVAELEGLVAEHPFREAFHAQLMLALYRCGRQAEALRAFQTARRSLGEELGIEPSPMLCDLEQQILVQDPALGMVQSAPDGEHWVPARNPYKGLRAFRPDETADFYGRDDLLGRLLERVERDRLVAVSGPSGSGKSSVVMAGVIPRLAPGQWTVVTVVPGRDPLTAVRSALERATPAVTGGWRGDGLDLVRAVDEAVSDGETRLLLVIDQFEELFHHVEDEAVRVGFVRTLVEAIEDPSTPLTLLITIRSDLLDRVLGLPQLGAMIEAAIVWVPPLRAHELEAAAARPAEASGLYVEPELVAELVGAMTDQPGALPLFQYVLTQIFEARTGPVLTRAAYRTLGGLTGALSRRAEDLYLSLDPPARALARQVVLRLVNVGDGREDSRRRVDRPSLEALDPEGTLIKEVLDAFDAARLLTFDRNPASGAATVEVAHEALLREWPRLSGWLDAAREDLRIHGAVMNEVAEWEAAGRDADYLATGSRLDLYERWRADAAIDLTEAEGAFLDESVARRAEETKREEARRDEELRLERRSVRRLRALVAVVSLAALVASGLTVFAVQQSRQAAASQREARARELGNAAVAAIETDPDLAMLLALEAIDVTRSVDGFVVREAEEALHAAVAAQRLVGSVTGRWDAAFLAGGDIVVGGNPVRIVDPTSGAVRRELPVPHGERDAEAVAVSHDGGTVAIGSTGDGWIGVWDASSGEQTAQFGSMGDTVAGLEFSPDGRLLAAFAPFPGRIQIWDLGANALLVDRFGAGVGEVYGPKEDLAFNDDGTLLAKTAAADVWILDVVDGTWRITLEGHESFTTSVAFVPGSDVIATAGTDETVRLWDAVRGTEMAAVEAGVGQVVSMTVGRDGTRLLVGGDRGTVRLFAIEASDLRPMMTLPGLRAMVTNVDLDAEGARAVAVGLDGAVATWDVGSGLRGEVASWSSDGPVAFDRDGTQLAVVDQLGRGVAIVATATWDTTAVIGDVVPYVGPENLGYGGEWGRIESLAFDPSGTLLAVNTHGYEVVPGTVSVWEAASGDLARQVTADMEPAGDVAFGEGGTRLASGSCGSGAPVTVWDTETWEPVFTAPGSVCARSADLSSDGRLVGVQSELFDEPNVFVWNVDGGDLVGEVTHRPAWRGAVAFSPDGTRLLTGGGDGTLRIWNTADLRPFVVLEGHTGPVEDAIWSSDGAMVVSAGLDGTVRFWDADTGAERLRLAGLDGQPSVSMTPDGRWLATSAGGVAEVWALDLDELIDIAEQRLTRSLTAAECVTYHFDRCPSAS